MLSHPPPTTGGPGVPSRVPFPVLRSRSRVPSHLLRLTFSGYVTISPGRPIPWPGDRQAVECGQHLGTWWQSLSFFYQGAVDPITTQTQSLGRLNCWENSPIMLTQVAHTCRQSTAFETTLSHESKLEDMTSQNNVLPCPNLPKARLGLSRTWCDLPHST